MRVASLLLLAGCLIAADAVPLSPPVGAFVVNVGQEGHLSYATDGKPSFADNGVTARYEGLFLACDRLEMIQTAVPGTTASALSSLLVKPGPKGPEGGKVLLDTRDTTSARFGFKGLLKPDEVTINRLPPDSTQPQLVQYAVALPNTGDFSGLMQMKDGWAPFRGWAEHTDLTLEGTVASGQLAQLRVTQIVLRGKPAAADGTGGRPAEINRLKTGSPALALDSALTSEQVDGHIDANEIIIVFDAAGRFGTRFSGAPHTWGDPRLFNAAGTP